MGRLAIPTVRIRGTKLLGQLSSGRTGLPSGRDPVRRAGLSRLLCSAWANGTYQCVSFVRGAYSQVYPMRLSANAFALWVLYATQPGWVKIPSGASPPDQRGLPQPGDVMVFKDASVGHVAIVMSVAVSEEHHRQSKPPGAGSTGSQRECMLATCSVVYLNTCCKSMLHAQRTGGRPYELASGL